MTHPSAHPSDDPNPPGDKPCSSPPCYAAEFPGYFGDGPAQQVVDGLNALLEAERAGARVLAILRDSVDARSPLHDLLGALQKDEGANAVQLYQTLRRLGGAASHETGAFVGKTLAIEGLVPRLRFVNKGQAWVVRKIDELLPAITDAYARTMLEEMRRSHLENIEACETALDSLPPG